MANFTVTTTEDAVDANDNETSLREAVISANGTVGADTISFASGVGEAFEGDAVIRLTQGEIEISDELTIDGATAGGAVVITGDADGDDALVAGTQITDVAASFGGTAGAADDLLDDNSRLFNLTGEDADTTFNSLTLTGGRTTGDSREFSGGAVHSPDADVTLTNSTLSGNSTTGDSAFGGGVYALQGAVTLTNSTLSGNSTTGREAIGGGVVTLNGAVTLINSTLSGNSTAGDGAVGGGVFTSDGAVTLINSTLSGNSTAGFGASGGGVFTNSGPVTLTNSTLSGNSTTGDEAAGGGVSDITGIVTLTNSTLNGNSTTGDGAVGGGVFAYSGAVTLINSTLSGNSTSGEGARGGGVFASYGAVTLSNSTLSGNFTTGAFADGGGVYVSNGAVTLSNSLVIGNVSALRDSDQIDGTLTLLGGNIVGNTFTLDGVEQRNDITADEVFARTETLTFGNKTTTAGVLDDNGGPVQTIGLLAVEANPAIDAAEGTLMTDARGLDRPVDLGADSGVASGDLGAVEAQALEAGSLVVTTTGESTFDDGVTSLREAVAFANATPGADTVTFDATVFADDAVIRLTQGEIEISDELTIDGATAGGAVVITGDADGDDALVAGTQITDVAASFGGTAGAPDDLLDDNSRLFNITGAAAHTTFNSLTLTGGRTTGDGFGFSGGAIRSGNSDVTLTGSTLSGNSTAGDKAEGGGVSSRSGEVTLTSSTLSGNSTTGMYARGGGVSSRSGEVTLTGSTLSGNSTTGQEAGGGGVYIRNGDVTLTDSTLSGNSTAGVRARGGGVYIDEGVLALTNSTLSGNSTAGVRAHGGGVSSRSGEVTLTDSTLSGNSTAGVRARGGGVYIDEGALALTNSTLSGNSTAGDFAVGGGVYLDEGALALTNSTLSGNSTAGDEAVGGGVYLDEGALALTNSTLSGNSTAGDFAVGGGVYVYDGAVTLTNSTLSGNSTAGDEAEGGGVFAFGGDVTLVNSLVIGNVSARTDTDEISGSLTLQGGNIVGDTFTVDGVDQATGITAAEVFADTQTLTVGSATTTAGVLDDNGGPVQTIALLSDASNPALDVGSDVSATTTTDARGLLRTFDVPGVGTSLTDLGAFELQPVDNTAPSALVLTNSIDSIAENVPLSSRLKIADIVVTDDVLGDNILAVTGDDAAMFEVDGMELFLRAGTVLDFETQARIDIRVTVDDPTVGDTPDASAALSLTITDANDLPTGAVTITGTVEQGSSLMAVSTLTDEDGLGTLEYQWLRDGAVIDGATSASYTLTQDDVGAAMSVRVSYTDGQGTAESKDSAATAAVASNETAKDETGTEGPDFFEGTSLDDKFDGLGGNDTANGGEGNDGLKGGPGDDELNGGPGDDKLPAGPGNDTSFGGEGNDRLGGGGGNDYMDGGPGNDGGGAGPGNDTVIGGDGNDRFNGGLDQDLMILGAGDDTAGGSFGNDTMLGGDGNDYLGGGAGNDSIDGEAGNDTIISGFGNDTVTGGDGEDQFIFNSLLAGGTTFITDFEDGTDKIKVTGLPKLPTTDRELERLEITETTVTQGESLEFEGRTGVEMTYGSHTIIVLDAVVSDFTDSDFVF